MGNGRFKPGKSGNPGGRPKDLQAFKQLCQKKSIIALNKVCTIMVSKKAKNSDIIKCAEIILERAYGKAIQEIKGVAFNQYSAIWTEAERKARNVRTDGSVNIGHKEEVPS